jgi:micrococcal nuclease
MVSLHKKIFVAAFFILFLSGNISAETNFEFFFPTAEQYKDVVVKQVLSADTIRLEGTLGEKDELVQLIGLRAPEPPRKRTEDIKRDEMGIVIKEPVDPMTPMETQAFAFTRELLEGQHVRLEFDSEKKTEDHKTLAYVFLLNDDTFVNALILRRGYAYLSIQPPNMKYAEELREAYKEARSEQRGLQAQ